MIYFFSGCGNTAYATRRLSSILGESCKLISDWNPEEESFEGNSLGFLFPVYSWGVPPNMLDFISRLPEAFWETVKEQNISVWMVCTHGDDAGYTDKMLSDALAIHDVNLKGAWSMIMPNTYVLLPGFDVDSRKVESKKLDSAPARIEEIGKKISSGDWETDIVRGGFPKVKTNLLYPGFVKMGINPKKWNWNAECIRCGKCVKACPVHNIRMQGGHPHWGENCVMCLGCYHHCPVHAINYKNRTDRKGQYTCPL